MEILNLAHAEQNQIKTKSFDEILKEIRLKYKDVSEQEIIIRAREQYIFQNERQNNASKNRKTSSNIKN